MWSATCVLGPLCAKPQHHTSIACARAKHCRMRCCLYSPAHRSRAPSGCPTPGLAAALAQGAPCAAKSSPSGQPALRSKRQSASQAFGEGGDSMKAGSMVPVRCGVILCLEDLQCKRRGSQRPNPLAHEGPALSISELGFSGALGCRVAERGVRKMLACQGSTACCWLIRKGSCMAARGRTLPLYAWKVQQDPADHCCLLSRSCGALGHSKQ